jgi:hypothetical protein
MKKLSNYLLPRYTWFMLWHKQWFKNKEGIKAFADQIMNWLMQETLGLATTLKKLNKQFSEKIREYKKLLEKWHQHATVDADEFDEIRNKVRKLGLWVIVIIIAESALNFFAFKSVIAGKGLGYLSLQIIGALSLTGGSIYFFEKLFGCILNEPNYKKEIVKKRSILELIVVFSICIGIEICIYFLCKYRGIILEGRNADSTVTNFVIICGMILPLMAGFLSYKRSMYLSPFKNTLRIAKIEKRVSCYENKIATNLQKMEGHFKQCVEDRWALHQEFRCYKENYNQEKNIASENIEGHYCENETSFIKEAVERYKKEAIQKETQQFSLPMSNTSNNNATNQIEISKSFQNY